MTTARTLAPLLLIAVASLLACSERQVTTAIGAVRVHSAITDAELFIDAQERGPLRDGMEVELPPGAHVLEARRGGVVVATLPVEVRAALLFEATLDPLPALAAMPSEVPPPPEPEPPVALPVPTPVAEPPEATRHVASDAERGSPTATPVEPPMPQNAPADPSLPTTPPRSEIAAVMRTLTGPAEACAGDEHGIVAVRLTFGSDGAVRDAAATSANLPPALEECVLEAARRLRVSAFSADRFTITYPVRY